METKKIFISTANKAKHFWKVTSDILLKLLPIISGDEFDDSRLWKKYFETLNTF